MLTRDLKFTTFTNKRTHTVIHTLLKDKQANLLKYPLLDPTTQDQITIGDMHGNALKFVHFLIRHQVITMSEADYRHLIKIYRLPVDKLTSDHLTHFNQILARTTVESGAFIRLLGDELADRGSNDYFTLKLLEKIAPQVQLEIILSNHALEFIAMFEDGLKNYTSDLVSGQARSLFNLGALVKKNLVDPAEISNIITEHYQPHLKIISYSLDESRKFISIYSHAPIGIHTVQSLATFFNVSYVDRSAIDLANTIENINKAFLQVVIDKKLIVASHLKDFALNTEIPLSLPILRTTWARDYSKIDLPKKHINRYQLCYIHGHDGGGYVKSQYKDREINLDNEFGKNSQYRGKYTVLFSPNKPLLEEEKTPKKLRRSERIAALGK